MTKPTPLAVEPKAFFDRQPPPQYLDEWIERLAQPEHPVEQDLLSLVIFRLHAEYLAVRTCCLVEVTLPQWIHVIPHRSNNVILGLVNIRGQLRICVSAHGLFGVEQTATSQQTPRDDTASEARATTSKLRMLILHEQSEQWVFSVEEVLGVHRLPTTDLRPVPSTFGNAGAFSQSVFSWEGHTVGYLDEAQFLSALRSACK
jgi:chemotaxis-related protein WspD